MFETELIRDVRPIRWLKRFFIFVIVTLVAIGAMSSYRAYVQVKKVELNAPRFLSPGEAIWTTIVTSGRTTVDVEVDLIQGTHSERVLKLQLPGNRLAFFDPRTQKRTEAVVLSKEMLSGFQLGPARLRSVATGRHQWMRLPPPTVQEMEVEIVESRIFITQNKDNPDHFE